MTSTKAPVTVRDTFDMLSEFRGDMSIRQFLGGFNWNGISTHQTYAAFLDRLPESVAVVRQHSRTDPLNLASNFLSSAEFQSRAIELTLRAYPEKRRLFHIHVPKSAGVDLRNNLTKIYPYLHYNHTRRESTTAMELITHVGELSRRLQQSSEILITGHIPLSWYLQRGLCRFQDRSFSVIRHPIKGLLSLVNYYLRRIRESPACDKPDTRSYARYLRVERFPEKLSPDDQRSLGIQMLMNKEMMERNLATFMLGEGTCDSAVELIVRSNIELVPIESYNAWLDKFWSIGSDTRANQSPPVLKLKDLDESQLAAVNNLCKEDLKLYERLMTAHKKLGGTRLFGADLALTE